MGYKVNKKLPVKQRGSYYNHINVDLKNLCSPNYHLNLFKLADWPIVSSIFIVIYASVYGFYFNPGLYFKLSLFNLFRIISIMWLFGFFVYLPAKKYQIIAGNNMQVPNVPLLKSAQAIILSQSPIFTSNIEILIHSTLQNHFINIGNKCGLLTHISLIYDKDTGIIKFYFTLLLALNLANLPTWKT